MLRRLLILLCAALINISFTPEVAHGQSAADDDFNVQLIPASSQMEAAAMKALQDCTPQEGKVVGEINKNGVYTLTGNLFRDGSLYSVIDDDDDVILCKWKKPGWKTLFAINVPTMWSFPAGYAHDQGSATDGQPDPFWIINFQNRPVLVIASIEEKSKQHYYSILFDSKVKKILGTVTSFGSRPVVKGSFFITGDQSTNKAEFQETDFSKIENDNFVLKKSWEGCQPYHAEDREGAPDDSSTYATDDGKGYLILPDNSGSKDPANYLIVRCDPGQDRPEIRPNPGQLFAAIYNTHEQDYNVGDPTILYLFKKLTGLPVELYPGFDDTDKSSATAPPSIFVVKGTDKEIMKLLSP